MVNKNKAIWKAAYIHLRIYIMIYLGFMAASMSANFIVFLAIGSEESSQVSTGNFLIVLLIIMAIVLPLGFFKKIVNIGATRNEYYTGLMGIYFSSAALLAIINVIFLKWIDHGLLKGYYEYFNILEIFRWDQFGIMGMFLYQFVVYLLLISLISMLFSGVRSYIGISLWVIIIAAIPITTSIASYRHKLADLFQTLLFNDSLFEGIFINLLLSCVFFIGGWLFTSKRTF